MTVRPIYLSEDEFNTICGVLRGAPSALDSRVTTQVLAAKLERHWEQADCISCGEEAPSNECKSSQRNCGHHCNCAWVHDECCWCNQTFGAWDEI